MVREKEKGYIDLSKRRVSPEDIAAAEERYNKSKMVRCPVLPLGSDTDNAACGHSARGGMRVKQCRASSLARPAMRRRTARNMPVLASARVSKTWALSNTMSAPDAAGPALGAFHKAAKDFV